MSEQFFKKIVVAITGSESSMHAAMYAILFAKAHACKLKFVFVVDMATIKQLTVAHFFSSDESESYKKNLTSEGEKILAYVERLSKSKSIPCETELRSGSVWAELVKVSDEWNADVIIAGGHLSASKQNASVENNLRDLLASAHCSVLVAKDKNVEERFKLA